MTHTTNWKGENSYLPSGSRKVQKVSGRNPFGSAARTHCDKRVWSFTTGDGAPCLQHHRDNRGSAMVAGAGQRDRIDDLLTVPAAKLVRGRTAWLNQEIASSELRLKPAHHRKNGNDSVKTVCIEQCLPSLSAFLGSLCTFFRSGRCDREMNLIDCPWNVELSGPFGWQACTMGCPQCQKPPVRRLGRFHRPTLQFQQRTLAIGRDA